MTEPAAASAGIPAPSVGLSLPPSPAVNAALDQYRAASVAYRDDPTPENKAAKTQAADELRRQRSLYRGGTDITTQEG